MILPAEEAVSNAAPTTPASLPSSAATKVTLCVCECRAYHVRRRGGMSEMERRKVVQKIGRKAAGCVPAPGGGERLGIYQLPQAIIQLRAAGQSPPWNRQRQESGQMHKCNE
jgi:hypothetical protein